uniref:Uncharacterized protein n=1 Tax=Chromera velia CCMP2878 TaxID=1169474 RepID=A0A0G4HW66_9ALVE|mmetsp:Transcript_54312/g.106277  ORF Transcript_54312/g.106277 Transcript_54312/m.106277 type:complete len:308 (+) Transcript_54312:208-1131(+)|eukprot:Cvel_8998.t1-p1 / transcript=Cvel_8998.t1 / gene=Cvel_8998 / organism=Chromera_velia_CCMP2878 / gene_product=hypothetical protein / transcript_product=hypothetical protein / location=Cvel_scaffold508:70382-73782(-) / protein_length=307 / sequence_SO=supercontig / SO=protein_coding / is_pseudo=false
MFSATPRTPQTTRVNECIFTAVRVLTAFPLRFGLLLQGISLIAISIASQVVVSGAGFIASAVTSNFATVTSDKTLFIVLTVFWGLYLVGLLGVLFFQSFLHTVGGWTLKSKTFFKFGGQLLLYGVTLDAIGTLALFAFWAQVYSLSLNASNGTAYLSSWLATAEIPFFLFAIVPLLRGIAYICYGVSFFFLEQFHETTEMGMLSWFVVSLYKVTGVMQFVRVFVVQSTLYSVVLGKAVPETTASLVIEGFVDWLQVVSVGTAFAWSIFFEPKAQDFEEIGEGEQTQEEAEKRIGFFSQRSGSVAAAE